MRLRNFSARRFCLRFAVAAALAVQVASAAPKAKTAPKDVNKGTAATAILTEQTISSAVGADKISNRTRHSLEEKYHGLLDNPKLKGDIKGPLLVALAVLHSFDSGIRYASQPLLAEAAVAWPELSKSPHAKSVWETLARNFGGRQVQEEVVLEEASRLLDNEALLNDPAFVFYRGVAHFHDGKFAEAVNLLNRVPLSSADYRRAKLIEAISFSQLDKLSEMQDALRMVVALDKTSAESDAGIPSDSVARLRELGVLTMARLMYEVGRFSEALAYYRSLDQRSRFFYDSLTEQGWAFFMAGYPNYALGANYAALSPFFEHNFNPDNNFLDSIISFWLCDFNISWNKLMRYIAHVKGEGDLLKALVARLSRQGDVDGALKAAKVVEDLLAGVSAANVGLGSRVAGMLKDDIVMQDTNAALALLLKVRMDYETRQDLPKGRERILNSLLAFETTLRRAFGRQARARMASLARDFDWTLTQARYLHLEILTARKDDLLGKERSVQGTEFHGQDEQFWELAKGADQKWKMDRNEYWFDELGHYVFDERSRCQNRSAPAK